MSGGGGGVGATPNKLTWKFDNTDISNFGIGVTASHGLVDAGKRKIGFRHNWAEENGEEVDLSYYAREARDIRLEMILVADGIGNAIANLNSFYAVFDKAGSIKMEVIYGTGDNKIEMQVFREEPVKVLKQFRFGRNIWTFTLQLKEYLGSVNNGGIVEEGNE